MSDGTQAPARTRYLPIAEHGLIGDLHTVAPVGTDGTIDRYCCPRFDSPSVFGQVDALQSRHRALAHAITARHAGEPDQRLDCRVVCSSSAAATAF
jgi:hypothetical protein